MKKLISSIVVFTMFMWLGNNVYSYFTYEIWTNGTFEFWPYYNSSYWYSYSNTIVPSTTGSATCNTYTLPAYYPESNIHFYGQVQSDSRIDFYCQGMYLGTLLLYYDNEAPSKPELTYTVTSNNFTINAVSNDRFLDSYFYKITGGSNEEGKCDGYIFKQGLKEGATYNVSVKAYDYVGNESEESSISITIPRSIEAPSVRTVTPSIESATLKWSTQVDAKQYYIYAPNGKCLDIIGRPNPQSWVSTMSYVVNNLKPGTTYSDYYIVSENEQGAKSEGRKFPNFTTKDFTISGPKTLCSKSSYKISNVDGTNYRVTSVTCGSTTRVSNGSTNSFELTKVSNGTGSITIKVKSKSTNTEYTRSYSLFVGIPPVPTSVSLPSGNLNVATTYNASAKGTRSDMTYNWYIDKANITKGQGTGNISFIISADKPLPTKSAMVDNHRSYSVAALSPKPGNPTQPQTLTGYVDAENVCGRGGRLNFSFTCNIPSNARMSVSHDSIDEAIALSIESESSSSENSFVIYPNPASSLINVRQPYDKESIKTIDIFDATGKKCIREVYNNDDSFASIDISSLPNGKYILIVNQNGDAQIGTFIKK